MNILFIALFAGFFFAFSIEGSPIIDQELEAIKYLQSFGYLPETKNTIDINQKQLKHALKLLQTNGQIPSTGKLDDDTLRLMKMPRCGVPDIIRNRKRQKRYELLSTQWEKHHILWNFDHKNGIHAQDAPKIVRIIREALNVWAENSMLTFEHIDEPHLANISISFEKADHNAVDRWPMYNPVMAHAFGPGSGIGGDVHFRIDLDWDFDVILAEQPTGDKTSFFAVALHELGHALGLSHTDKSDAVMYDFYHKSTGVLSADDIEGIHHIYGVPKRSTETTTFVIESTYDDIPDKCDTSYDAVATIRNELFIFKQRYFWRNPNTTNAEATKIRSMWKEIPENFTHVDAVYENDDGKLMFFIGSDIYGFSGTKFEFKSSLSKLGIDHHFKKIDAIFKWHFNQRTYIFSGDDYWRLDGKMVNRHYPKDILRSWRNVYDIDTAFSNNEKLFFFKGTSYYEFDSPTMRLDRMNPQPSAQNFMGCEGEKVKFKLSSRFGDENVDVIDEGVIEIPEDTDNIEKFLDTIDDVPVDGKNETETKITKDSAATHHLILSIIMASLAVSRVLPSILLYL